jgi:hypothetical protein
MTDVDYFGIAGPIVEIVEERYGKPAAYAVAVLLCALPLILIAGAIWWFVS